MSKVGHQFYLPVDQTAECFNSSQGFCFLSGDTRTTIHPGMTMVQTLFHRHHNYIAKKLGKLNPHWDDEECYQEARRINIGCFQHIVYTEYLPLLLGKVTKLVAFINIPISVSFKPRKFHFLNLILLCFQFAEEISQIIFVRRAIYFFAHEIERRLIIK